VQTGPTAHRPAAKLCHNGWHYNSPHAMSEAAIGVMHRTKLRRSCRPPIRATASWDKNTTVSASCAGGHTIASRLSQSSRHKSCAVHPPTLLDLRPVYYISVSALVCKHPKCRTMETERAVTLPSSPAA
jgi:hypothetical protein